jgi:hypothetical protein
MTSPHLEEEQVHPTRRAATALRGLKTPAPRTKKGEPRAPPPAAAPPPPTKSAPPPRPDLGASEPRPSLDCPPAGYLCLR